MKPPIPHSTLPPPLATTGVTTDGARYWETETTRFVLERIDGGSLSIFERIDGGWEPVGVLSIRELVSALGWVKRILLSSATAIEGIREDLIAAEVLDVPVYLDGVISGEPRHR